MQNAQKVNNFLCKECPKELQNKPKLKERFSSDNDTDDMKEETEVMLA